MSSGTRGLVYLAIASLAISCGVTSLSPFVARSEQEVVERWVASLNEQDLEIAVGKISQYPERYRPVIVAALTPSRRSAVWRDHIESYLRSRALPLSQQQTLRAVAAIMSDEAFASPADRRMSEEQLRGSLAPLVTEAQSFLDRETLRNLLYKLGPRDGTFRPIAPLLLELHAWARSHLVVLASAECWGEACNCDTFCNPAYDCSFGDYCRKWQVPLLSCSETYWGCCVGGLFSCQGCCAPIIPN